MPTDCDRFASVLDKRFERFCGLLEEADPTAAVRIAEHLFARHLEAAPNLREIYREAARLLGRAPMLLESTRDPEIQRFRRIAEETNPGTRLYAAFKHVLMEGGDLADRFSGCVVRWFEGQMNTKPSWKSGRAECARIRSNIHTELVAKVRNVFLGIPTSVPARKRKPGTLVILRSTISVKK